MLTDNCRVLVTGGTGSFGKTIVKRLLGTEVSEVVIFSRDEQKQVSLKREVKDDRLTFVIGCVRNRDALNRAMQGIDYVFSAAAIKHVPVAEDNPYEAVLTNVIGVQNVIDTAILNNVKKVINISTDKAVEPINVMGMTKALGERICSSAKGRTKVITVRYGNVLASRGSVVPFFSELIKKDSEIPLTHADMTRFILTLRQAIDLVLYSVEYGDSGDLFVSNIPALKITDLIRAMFICYNKECKIIDVGIRKGEKIHEVLLSAEEASKAELIDDTFYRVQRNASCKNRVLPLSSDNVRFLNVDEIVEMLRNEAAL